MNLDTCRTLAYFAFFFRSFVALPIRIAFCAQLISPPWATFAYILHMLHIFSYLLRDKVRDGLG